MPQKNELKGKLKGELPLAIGINALRKSCRLNLPQYASILKSQLMRLYLPNLCLPKLPISKLLVPKLPLPKLYGLGRKHKDGKIAKNLPSFDMNHALLQVKPQILMPSQYDAQYNSQHKHQHDSNHHTSTIHHIQKNRISEKRQNRHDSSAPIDKQDNRQNSHQDKTNFMIPSPLLTKIFHQHSSSLKKQKNQLSHSSLTQKYHNSIRNHLEKISAKHIHNHYHKHEAKDEIRDEAKQAVLAETAYQQIGEIVRDEIGQAMQQFQQHMAHERSHQQNHDDVFLQQSLSRAKQHDFRS